jgi:hypothetical protein
MHLRALTEPVRQVGGFFIASKVGGIAVESQLIASRRQFARAGFPAPITMDTEEYTADYYPKYGDVVRNHVSFGNGDFIFSAGTFIYEGLAGVPALRRFFEKTDHEAELPLARGHFVLLIRKGGRTSLLRDRLGAYNVFHLSGLRFITSSYVAALAVSPTYTISAQEVYEYVICGGTFGAGTPLEEILRLDLHEGIVWNRTPALLRPQLSILPEESREPPSELIGRNHRHLTEQMSELGRIFGNSIWMALSGGYDSRLLLALFRSSGISPKLFVYGGTNDKDVINAKRIAESEKLDLVHIDKSRTRDFAVADFPAAVENNFFQEDAIPWEGIFSNGAEIEERARRNEGGALHVNGGGGEVYRNYYNLTDRAITPRQFVWLFFRGIDPSHCTKLFDAAAYESRMAAKAAAAAGEPGAKLSRRQVESLYPYFRCRAWFGPENTINNRTGYSILPFFDFRTVTEALRVPVRLKYFGDFEAALIRAADPVLAAYPSNYGHSFAENAPFKFRVMDMLTYARPLHLRRNAVALKGRLAKPQPRPNLVSDAYLSRVIDTAFPYMSKYFHVGRIKPVNQFVRICTLEYLFSRVGAR